MKRLFAILLACIVCQGVSFAQQYASTVETFRIAGKVTDMHDGCNVIDARVEISWEKLPEEFSPFMLTNLDGFYALLVPKGKLKLQVRALGYEDGEMDLDVTRDMVVNVELEPASIDDREHFARGWDKVVIKKVLEFEAKGGAC